VKPTIRHYVTGVLFGTTLVTLLMVGGFFLLFTATYALDLGRSYLRLVADELTRVLSIQERQEAYSPAEFQKILGQMNLPPELGIRILNSSRVLMAEGQGIREGDFRYPRWMMDSIQSSRSPFPPRSPMGEMMIPRGESDFLLGNQGFVDSSRYEVSFRLGGQGYIIQLETPRSLTDELVRTAALGFVVAALLALAITGLLSFFTARAFARPISSLTTLVSQVQPMEIAQNPQVLRPQNDPPTREIQALHEQFYHLGTELSSLYGQLTKERDGMKDFLADASHELRTPLMAAGTFLELSQATIERGQDPRGNLKDLERQLGRIGDIVQGLLNLTRLEGGIAELHLEPQRLTPVLDTVLEDLSSAYPDVQANIEWSSDFDDPQVMADPQALRTVLQNILENSFIHGTNDDHLDLWIGRGPNANKQTNQSRFILEIRDKGPGMSPEMVAKAGTRFLRGPNSKGTGLGLSTARTLVEKMGGNLEVLPAEGFLLRLYWPQS